MDILLLNDATFARYFPSHFRVLSAGPDARYIMPEQDLFNLRLERRLDHNLDEVITRCKSLIPDFNPDVIIQFETSTNYFYRGIEKSPALTVWRPVDNHMFYGWQPVYAQVFDLVLIAQKDYLDHFRQFHNNVHWLPLSTNTKVHYDRNMERDIPVSFVGNINTIVNPERKAFIEALVKIAPVQVFSDKTQEEIAQIYNRSKIVLNQCLNGDLNYRFFEALSNGALCLTPRINAGLSDFFLENEDFVFYEDKDLTSAKEKIDYLLANQEEIERIRKNGHKKTVADHNISNRVSTALDIIEKNNTKTRMQNDFAKTSQLISLLSEFTFGERVTNIHHMQDMISHCAKLDPKATAYSITDLALKFHTRKINDALYFMLNTAKQIPYTDDLIKQAHTILLNAAKNSNLVK